MCQNLTLREIRAEPHDNSGMAFLDWTTALGLIESRVISRDVIPPTIRAPLNRVSMMLAMGGDLKQANRRWPFRSLSPIKLQDARQSPDSTIADTQQITAVDRHALSTRFRKIRNEHSFVKRPVLVTVDQFLDVPGTGYQHPAIGYCDHAENIGRQLVSCDLRQLKTIRQCDAIVTPDTIAACQQ